MSYDYTRATPLTTDQLQNLMTFDPSKNPEGKPDRTLVQYIFIKDKELTGIVNSNVALKVPKGYVPQTKKLFKKGDIVQGRIILSSADAPNIFTFEDWRSNIIFSIPMMDVKGEPFTNFLKPYNVSKPEKPIIESSKPPLFSYHFGEKTISVTGKQLFIFTVLAIGGIYASYKLGLIKK